MVIQHWACVILISTHLVWLNTEWSTRWSIQDKIVQHGIRCHPWSRQHGVDVSHDHTRSIIWPKAKQGYRIFLGVATLFHFWPVLLPIQKWSCTFLQCCPPLCTFACVNSWPIRMIQRRKKRPICPHHSRLPPAAFSPSEDSSSQGGHTHTHDVCSR